MTQLASVINETIKQEIALTAMYAKLKETLCKDISAMGENENINTLSVRPCVFTVSSAFAEANNTFDPYVLNPKLGIKFLLNMVDANTGNVIEKLIHTLDNEYIIENSNKYKLNEDVIQYVGSLLPNYDADVDSRRYWRNKRKKKSKKQ